MCRTLCSLVQSVICLVQMVVRIFMTVVLMIESLIRMILQTLYNFISFVLQLISLIPICIVFLLSSRLKCFLCSGGGGCGGCGGAGGGGGPCDCIIAIIAIYILYLIFKSTGTLDKLMAKLGYTQANTKPNSDFRLIANNTFDNSTIDNSTIDSDYLNLMDDEDDSTPVDQTTEETVLDDVSTTKLFRRKDGSRINKTTAVYYMI
ncbi:Uncharacterized protein OBRU01_05566 [Operophtera brumata]|uniref:Uncharacterized protein n=1 Tax=Operophtera brumata TaxID=104452 RepID=A0A0L7LMG1_OPEBR|nr:Uncharacterized protein OBRU01_05566 [Operophtera brumata]